MRSKLLALSLFLSLSAIGCSSANDANVAEFKSTAQNISTAVARHRTAAAAATTVDDCNAELTRYGGEMQPMVDHMSSMSGSMDDCMGSMSGMGGMNTGAQTMQAMCTSMRDELKRHLASGCASADMAANHQDAIDHCDTMDGLAMSETQDANSMMTGGMTDSSGMCKK